MVIQDFWIAVHAEGCYKNMWISWARTSLDGLGTYLEYSIPNAFMELSFIFSIELFVCLSGYEIILNSHSLVAKNDFSAQVVSMNIFMLAFIIP